MMCCAPIYAHAGRGVSGSDDQQGYPAAFVWTFLAFFAASRETEIEKPVFTRRREGAKKTLDG